MKRGALACLGVLGLLFVGVGTRVALNWDSMSGNLGEAMDAQAQRTKATLFRLGELMSMSVAVKRAYGVEPDVSYDTASGARVLNITFSDYPLPEGTAPGDHARDIAAFVVGKTAKVDEIDLVTVLFRTSSENGVVENKNRSTPFRFEPDELVQALGGARLTEPAGPVRE